MIEKIENHLALIAETLILILLNQFGQSEMIEEAKPVIQNLKNRLIEINKND